MVQISSLVFFLFLPSLAHSGNVLVFPGEFSHWLNMRSILTELVKRNHSVTILIPETTLSINYNDSSNTAMFHFLVYKVPFLKSEFESVFADFIQFSMFESHEASLLQKFFKMRNWLGRSISFGMQQCDSMLKNEQLMATLHNAAFDVALLDPVLMCGDLVADVLGVPLILSLRFSFGNVMERHCGHAPAPLSYVPTSPLPYSDRMTFMERMINTLTYVVTSAMTMLFWEVTLDQYYTKVKGSPTSVCETLGKADIWLIRTFWDLETPRPMPPNFKYVGGLHCKPANKLPDDMEAFVQSSGDAGVVVVSFGTMVHNLPTERADIIAAALGQIPQKVLWRYSGEPPKTLAANTKLYNWLPQNDLLGHPKTRAFVTHGGTNGLYETVYHAVPVVGIPLFADQPENLARLSSRGGAIILEFHQLTTDKLTQALQDVINEPSYRSNMQRLSAVHRDRPVSPLNSAVFWVEFVMRNGGARHLRLASRELNWFQYHSLDCAAALLVIAMTAGFLCWAVIRCVLRRCARRRREKSD